MLAIFFPAKLSSADPKLLRRLESEIYLAPWSQTIIYFDPLKTIADITSQVNCLDWGVLTRGGSLIHLLLTFPSTAVGVIYYH